ncbi:MAG: HAMP domain-containing sensor histidine kinase [Planctomycetales bacterium]|nr:HAMP domain-containing sensor histidine kinase [Planctomycetales bacterium]
MFLTRSIRRKLFIGLVLVLLMLLSLGVAGLSGLLSYRRFVHDLKVMDSEPSPTKLVTACARLFDPLWLRELPDPNLAWRQEPVTGRRRDLDLDHPIWRDRVEHALQELHELRIRLVQLYDLHPSQRQPIILNQLDGIQRSLSRLGQVQVSIDSTAERQETLDTMLRDVAWLQTVILNLPIAEQQLSPILAEADTAYRWRIWLIGVCSVIVVGLLYGLFQCGYAWVFVPVRKLHDAALRVANGDYKHRLKLPGRDEMVDLADSFNRMIDRFQRDKSEADREALCRGEQMVRNKHLVDLGQMASGIAHEINNPLSAISMAADSLVERLAETESQFGSSPDDRGLLRTYLNMIQHATERCQQITRRTLEIARGNNSPRVRYDVTKIVAEVLEMVRHIEGFGHVEIRFDSSQSHPADVNAGEIEQVILNLLMNALESMEGMESGSITIMLAESVDEVILNIQDTGCGMTPHILSHLYKPFFTEKPSGKGTGLGLSIVDRIMGDHGGRIEAFSEGLGKGSSFRIHLPRTGQEASKAA